jgi:hypothetical protein
LDRNREVHERAIEALKKDLNDSKNNYSKLKIKDSAIKERIKLLISKIYKIKTVTKIFRALHERAQKKIYKKNKHAIILNYLAKKRRRVIWESWKNIVNSQQKGRIKFKYGEIFKNKYNELQSCYGLELKRLQDILNTIENQISDEMNERKALSKLYDENMNIGVDVFLKETKQNIQDFNSSSNFIIYN